MGSEFDFSFRLEAVGDGKESGTSSAPLDFMDRLGKLMRDGLVFFQHALLEAGSREKIRLGVSGKTVSGFDITGAMEPGAERRNSARGFMFALGRIRSLSPPRAYASFSELYAQPHAGSFLTR